MMEGWIKLHRKSINSSVFRNSNLWKVWTYCLLRANHKQSKILFEGKEMVIHPGQFITGRFQGAKDCNMKPSTFRDQLYKLRDLKNLDIKSDNKNSLLTVVNWDFYQGPINLSDTKFDNKPTQTRINNKYNKGNGSITEEDFKLTFKGALIGQ